jgi:multiple sugar transport system substrate-binding protein
MASATAWIQAAWMALAGLALCAGSALAQPAQRLSGSDSTVVKVSDIVPPRVVPPCKPGACRFAGKTVTVLVTGGIPIARPIYELKDEYEAATGARLNIVELTID